MRQLIAKKPKLLETKKEILKLVQSHKKLFNPRDVSVDYSMWPKRYFTVDDADYQYVVSYYSRYRHIVNCIDIKQFSYLSKVNYPGWSNEIWKNLGAKQIRLLLKSIKATV